jgi:subtilisin
MHIQKKFILIFAGLAMFAACKKENANKAPEPPQECLESNAEQSGQIIEGKYIVAYNASFTSRGTTESQLTELSEDVLSRNAINAEAMENSFPGEPGGFIAHLSEAEVTRLRNDPAVAIIEPDRIIKLNTCFTIAEPRLVTWNINRVGYGNGIGKRAWIIDSGIDFDHPDLTVDATKSKSFISGVTSAEDEHGHGTHVAGIIGGKNNTFGVLGVASGATVISLRVLDGEGSGSISSIIQALSYINNNAEAGDVVNMSLGDDEGVSTILDQQVQNTAARGILIAIAAGNDHVLANTFSPARANGTNIFTVSAIDSLDNFASFSNYGNDVVDYAAPGVRILSTYTNGRYAIMSGTSMAAPHMAGLLLLKGRNIVSAGTARNDPDGTPDPIAHY